MGKTLKLAGIFGAIILFGPIVLYVGAWAIAAAAQGYSWKDMDWNQDGTTSMWEFFMSSDVGRKTVQKDGMKCTEFFAFKDGMPVKVVCKASTELGSE